MLSVQHVSIVHLRDLRPLIRDVSFTLSGYERLAVIGEEGNGKSALLKAICQPEELSDWARVEGRIAVQGERLGYLAQEAPQTWCHQPVYELCAQHPAFLDTSPGELSSLCRALSMDSASCWQDTPFELLSGGDRVKLRLLLLLCARPTMLVLDEPGNDLDLDALEALETYLLSCGLPVLFVSHDETLLSRCATQVLHLESLRGRAEPRWTLSRTPYDVYVRERRSRLDHQRELWHMERREQRAREEKLNRIENAVAYAQEHISRGDPHGARLLKKKMKAVKSLEHRYDREAAEGVERPEEEFAMNTAFMDTPPLPAGKRVLDIHLERLTAGDRTLAEPLELSLRGAEKVLIIGENGSGKTTLLRLIVERLAVDASLRIAVMPQRYEEMLDMTRTPVEFLNPEGDKEQMTMVRSTLVSMKFSRDELTHPIGCLSGGQKAKVLLLSMMLRRPNMLLLDEPTRNLSPLSAPVVREMTLSFPGAVICVTHDRLLMNAWPGRILRLTSCGLVPVDMQSGAELT